MLHALSQEGFKKWFWKICWFANYFIAVGGTEDMQLDMQAWCRYDTDMWLSKNMHPNSWLSHFILAILGHVHDKSRAFQTKYNYKLNILLLLGFWVNARDKRIIGDVCKTHDDMHSPYLCKILWPIILIKNWLWQNARYRQKNKKWTKLIKAKNWMGCNYKLIVLFQCHWPPLMKKRGHFYHDDCKMKDIKQQKQ